MNHPFLTLARPVQVQGTGLHSGCPVTVRLLPRAALGVVFVRTDMPGAPPIAAALRHVSHTTHATTLACEGATVSTTEHLLAALWANGVSHCAVMVHGPELPIFDGSAATWQALLEEAGLCPLPGRRPVFGLRHEVCVEERGAKVCASPGDGLDIDVEVEYGRDYLCRQQLQGRVSPHFWREELAAARTFTLEEWIEPLRQLGLIKGGSEESAIVLKKEAPSVPLRYETEMARHKALDLLGDIALLFGENGGLLHARLHAVRAGHELHRQWMTQCLQSGALQEL